MNELEQLPVFVYGTLRIGQPNHRLLIDRVDQVESVTVQGLRLHDAGWFPYAVATGDVGDVVIGELHHLAAATYDETLARLDRLEGYDDRRRDTSHYFRVAVEAQRVDGEASVSAWAYVVGHLDAERVAALPVVESGDWLLRPALTA